MTLFVRWWTLCTTPIGLVTVSFHDYNKFLRRLLVEGQLHDILVVSRRFEDKRMNLFTQEIRKNPEGLAFDQELDLLKECKQSRNLIVNVRQTSSL